MQKSVRYWCIAGLAVIAASLRIWDLQPATGISREVGLSSAFSCRQLIGRAGDIPQAWFPDSTVLLVTRPGRTVRINETRALLLSELWMVPADGRPASRLTENGIWPAISPDGRQIAYLSYRGNGEWEKIVQSLSSEHAARTSLGPTDPNARPRWDKSMGVVWEELYLHRATRITDAGERTTQLVFLPGPRLTLKAELDGDQRTVLSDAPGVVEGVDWSPDGRRLAYALVAPGTGNQGTIFLWDATTSVSQELKAGSFPLWSPDGRFFASRVAEGIELIETGCLESMATELASGEMQVLPSLNAMLSVPARIAAQLVPPATIRVLHSASNYYRSSVPPGQIDIIPFEEYVKRVVPYEVPRTWPQETLKAQAVAARTYAWWFVLRHATWDYDVNDWTDYQVMGDQTWPETNAAVEATRGQYIAYGGEVILAEFSHQNGHPTVGRAGFPYMQPVADPVSFGETRHGHGRGFSQEGGRRWAAWHGWNYEQMLMHYYTGVTVERPANQSSGPLPPAGALVSPMHNTYLNTNWIRIRANASDADGDVDSVTCYAGWKGPNGEMQSQRLDTGRRESDGWYFLWDVSSLSDQGLVPPQLTITATVMDSGMRITGLNQLVLGLDRQAPIGNVQAPAQVPSSTVILEVEGEDRGPSGLAGILLSNDWRWEETHLYSLHDTGQRVPDPEALDGWAWKGSLGKPEVLYGPYTHALAPGRPYRALFRLKTDIITETREIAVLDVVDNAGATLLGIRRLRGVDFRRTDAYQEFGVDFWYQQAGASGLEFRVASHGLATLSLDRVLVTVYPIAIGSQRRPLTWELPAAVGEHIVRAKFADQAGNHSEDLVLAIRAGALTPTATPSPTLTPTTAVITPTSTYTATPFPVPTSTPPPTGRAYIAVSIAAIFGDENRNGTQEDGEPILTDVLLRFVDAANVDMVPAIKGGSWNFIAPVEPGRTYRLLLSRPGFQARAETLIAPSAGATMHVHISLFPLQPWTTGALLPRIAR